MHSNLLTSCNEKSTASAELGNWPSKIILPVREQLHCSPLWGFVKIFWTMLFLMLISNLEYWHIPKSVWKHKHTMSQISIISRLRSNKNQNLAIFTLPRCWTFKNTSSYILNVLGYMSRERHSKKCRIEKKLPIRSWKISIIGKQVSEAAHGWFLFSWFLFATQNLRGRSCVGLIEKIEKAVRNLFLDTSWESRKLLHQRAPYPLGSAPWKTNHSYSIKHLQ